MRKPQFTYVSTAPNPPRAGPSKTSWEQLEARLEAPEVKREGQKAVRRAEQFQASVRKSQPNRRTR